MAELEDLAPGARVRGVLPARAVTVVQVEWHGTQALAMTYRDDAGRVDHELLYRADEARLEIEGAGRSWSFDADGMLFRLASEALRIRLAHLFDPYLAVHTSNLDPLPHQIRAVSFHDLRHAAASRMIDAGLDPVTVATVLGHEDPHITLKTYAARFNKQRKDEAVRIALAGSYASGH